MSAAATSRERPKSTSVSVDTEVRSVLVPCLFLASPSRAPIELCKFLHIISRWLYPSIPQNFAGYWQTNQGNSG